MEFATFFQIPEVYYVLKALHLHTLPGAAYYGLAAFVLIKTRAPLPYRSSR